MSEKITIIVKKEGLRIQDRANSPVRKLPDGTAGVVINGLVYAVHEDHSIELAEQAVPKSECPAFFAPGEPLVYAAADDDDDWWCLEKTSRGLFLAFDGDEAFAKRLECAFQTEGLSQGYNESFRPARNGYFYDYYIRLDPDADEDDVRRIIDKVLEKKGKDDNLETVQERLKQLTEHSDRLQAVVAQPAETASSEAHLKREIDWLHQEKLKQQKKIDTLEAQLVREREEKNRLKAKNESLAIERIRLQSDIKKLLSQKDDADLSWDDLKAQEIDNLHQHIAKSDEKIQYLTFDNSRLRAQIINKEKENESLQEEIENEKLEQRPLDITAPETSRYAKKEKQILNDVLTGAFDRLVLQETDLKALLREFGSISHCVKVMSDIQEGRDLQHVKPWQGLSGVFEVPNIKTGIKNSERMGRLYFRKSSESNKIEVAVHVKSGDGKQQEEFVRNRFQ